MGDRGVILVTDNYHPVPICGIYVHWSGGRIPDILKKAGPKMRRSDSSYAIARLCGVIHDESPDRVTGLGILPPPENMEEDTLDEYGPGDAGIAIVNGETGHVDFCFGYLSDEYQDGIDIKLSDE